MELDHEDDNTAAIANVREAMELVEEAQRNLMRACEKLSPIIGGAAQWTKTGKLHDRVHAHWYAMDVWLRTNAHKLHMDGTWKISMARKG